MLNMLHVLMLMLLRSSTRRPGRLRLLLLLPAVYSGGRRRVWVCVLRVRRLGRLVRWHARMMNGRNGILRNRSLLLPLWLWRKRRSHLLLLLLRLIIIVAHLRLWRRRLGLAIVVDVVPRDVSNGRRRWLGIVRMLMVDCRWWLLLMIVVIVHGLLGRWCAPCRVLCVGLRRRRGSLGCHVGVRWRGMRGVCWRRKMLGGLLVHWLLMNVGGRRGMLLWRLVRLCGITIGLLLLLLDRLIVHGVRCCLSGVIGRWQGGGHGDGAGGGGPGRDCEIGVYCRIGWWWDGGTKGRILACGGRPGLLGLLGLLVVDQGGGGWGRASGPHGNVVAIIGATAFGIPAGE